MPVKVYSSAEVPRPEILVYEEPTRLNSLFDKLFSSGGSSTQKFSVRKLEGTLTFFGKTYSYRPSQDYMQFALPNKLNNLKFKR